MSRSEFKPYLAWLHKQLDKLQESLDITRNSTSYPIVYVNLNESIDQEKYNINQVNVLSNFLRQQFGIPRSYWCPVKGIGTLSKRAVTPETCLDHLFYVAHLVGHKIIKEQEGRLSGTKVYRFGFSYGADLACSLFAVTLIHRWLGIDEPSIVMFKNLQWGLEELVNHEVIDTAPIGKEKLLKEYKLNELCEHTIDAVEILLEQVKKAEEKLVRV